jgi:hypothetical protein
MNTNTDAINTNAETINTITNVSVISLRSVEFQSDTVEFRFLSVFELFRLATGRNVSATGGNASVTGRKAINTVENVSKIGCQRVGY